MPGPFQVAVSLLWESNNCGDLFAKLTDLRESGIHTPLLIENSVVGEVLTGVMVSEAADRIGGETVAT